MPKTGEICQRPGIYDFVRHIDGSVGCHPSSEEKMIPLSRGDAFPPIKSCKKGAIWTFVRDT